MCVEALILEIDSQAKFGVARVSCDDGNVEIMKCPNFQTLFLFCGSEMDTGSPFFFVEGLRRQSDDLFSSMMHLCCVVVVVFFFNFKVFFSIGVGRERAFGFPEDAFE